MLSTLLAIAPIFLLIVLGHALRRGGIPSADFWNQNDRLVYWLLFPALLFYKMATLELAGELLGQLTSVIFAGFFAALLFAYAASRLFKFQAPLLTCVLQGAARHNTFIALAVAERLFGAEGLAIAAVITALLIPITNVSIVTLMTILLKKDSGKHLGLTIVKELSRNPLLIAVLLGMSVNMANIEYIPVLYDICLILGGAALPIVLLGVGANIKVRAMTMATSATVLSIIGKMLVFPLAIALVGWALHLDPLALQIAIIFGAVPSAASAYTLARQMGGDAAAMAAIVTIQTAVSFFTLPFTMWLCEYWLKAGL